MVDTCQGSSRLAPGMGFPKQSRVVGAEGQRSDTLQLVVPPRHPSTKNARWQSASVSFPVYLLDTLAGIFRLAPRMPIVSEIRGGELLGYPGGLATGRIDTIHARVMISKSVLFRAVPFQGKHNF